MKKHIVLMPIEVPTGDYCWNFDRNQVCEHFDNTGGHATCDLDFFINDRKRDNIYGVPKPAECLQLKEDKCANSK